MKRKQCGFTMARIVAVIWLCVWSVVSFSEERFITVASTTSTEDSGLFDDLLPRFRQESGIQVRVVAVGTGKAIRMASQGDVDVLLVHHKPSEERFVAQGHGVARFDVMCNDFVIVGPDADPAGVAGKGVRPALQAMAASARLFASRGDDSGTHKREQALWEAAGVIPESPWYRETGSGMGSTLNVASALGAYTLTDRATWLKFANKGDLRVMVEGDPVLFNRYGVILVNPVKFPHIRAEDGQAFIDWLLSPSGQAAINAYRLEGQQAFFASSAAEQEQGKCGPVDDLGRGHDEP